MNDLTISSYFPAKELSTVLKHYNIKHIFASPFSRTVQTVYPIAEELNIKIRLENGVTEYLPTEVVNPPVQAVLAEKYPLIDLKYKSKMPLPSKESQKFLMERSKQIVRHIAETFTTAEDTTNSTSKQGLGDVLIVTHAATKIALVTHRNNCQLV